MRTLSFFVPGIAQPAGSKRIGRHGTRYVVLDDNEKSAGWKERVALAAAEAKRKAGCADVLWDGALELSVKVYRARPKGHLRTNGEVREKAPKYPTTKPDTTKLVRGLEDALTGVLWQDDAQVVKQFAVKEWADELSVPGVLVMVEQLD